MATFFSLMLKDEIVAKADLSLRQAAVLEEIYHKDADHENGVKEIAERLGINKPAVTRALDYLESNGLVTRNQNAADRRKVTLVKTEDGKTLYSALNRLIGRQAKDRAGASAAS